MSFTPQNHQLVEDEVVDLSRGTGAAASAPGVAARHDLAADLGGESDGGQVTGLRLKIAAHDKGNIVALLRQERADVSQDVKVALGDALAILKVDANSRDLAVSRGADRGGNGTMRDNDVSTNARHGESHCWASEDRHSRSPARALAPLRRGEQRVPSTP